MSNKKFVVHYPYKCFSSTSTTLFKDLMYFYNNLRIIFCDLNIYSEWIDSMQINYTIDNPEENTIYLGHQNYKNTHDNVWCVKTAYLPGYVYVDPAGYARWAYITTHKELFHKSQTMDFETSKKKVLEYAETYKSGNNSRLPQPDVIGPEPSYPYFFYTYQNWYDDPQVYAIADYLQQHGYKLIVKYHPQLREASKTLLPHENIIIKNDSIHKLIPASSGVISTNSGVGFEALLYDKHVFTFGNSDYIHVAHQLTMDTIDTILPIANTPFEIEKVYKYIYYLMEHYWVEAANMEKIKTRIKMILTDSKDF